MSAARTSRRLVRLYPIAWRVRYGDELAHLIVETSAGERVPWRTRLDVALGAARAHAHELSDDSGRPPRERARAGALAVLWAWMLLVIAGLVVQRISEHWQSAVPAASRSTPSAAFDCLVASAAIGGVLVLAGIAAALPAVRSFLRAGGLAEIRTPLRRSALITLAQSVALAAVVLWAGRLTTHQRNGGSTAYGLAFGILAVLTICCLVSWTATAAAVAERLELTRAVLRFQALTGTIVAAAMGVVTVATVAWWFSATAAAPGFLAGRSSALAVTLLAATVAMVAATTLATAGARCALRASALGAG